MPVWPELSTKNGDALDSVMDKPELAVPALYDAFTAAQAIIAARGVADGIASLGADGKVPAGQIGAFEAYLGSALQALNGLTPAADKLPYFTGASAAALATVTGYMRTVLAAADAAGARDLLGVLGVPEEIDGMISAAGLTPSTGDNTQLTQASLILSQRANRIINGQFFHRFNAPVDTPVGTTGSNYVSEQWRVQANGGTYGVNRLAFVRGQTDVPAAPVYYLEVINSSTAGSANYCRLAQPMEDVNILAGRTVTVSFWAKVTTTPAYITVCLRQYFAGGSAPVEGIGRTKVLIGTTWAQHAVTIDVDSIAGKTGGTATTTYTELQLWLDAGTDFNAITDSLGHQSITLHLTNVACGIGHVPLSYDTRLDFEENQLVRRYYEIIGDGAYNTGIKGGTIVGVQGVGASVATYLQAIRFTQIKRVSPTITLLNPTAENNEVRNITINADCSASIAAYSAGGGCIVTFTSAPGSAIGNTNAVNLIANARFS